MPRKKKSHAPGGPGRDLPSSKPGAGLATLGPGAWHYLAERWTCTQIDCRAPLRAGDLVFRVNNEASGYCPKCGVATTHADHELRAEGLRRLTRAPLLTVHL